MAGEEHTIHVNFGRPIPIFPLDAVTLFPQQLLPLHIFEPRYRQMVEHAIDGAGLIAMAVFEGNQWHQHYHGRPAIRPAVCVGHIAGHEKLSDGRYNLILQGVCRARIAEELPPDDNRLYRLARLEPVGIEGMKTGAELYFDDVAEAALDTARQQVMNMLSSAPLSGLSAAESVLELLRNEELPTNAVLDLVTFKLLSEPAMRYRMLAEPDARTRATILVRELSQLERLAKLAKLQLAEHWPKGMSWN